jgi:hypothetical protein
MPRTGSHRPLNAVDIALRIAIVALSLSTAWIHLTLGGTLFTLNATGFVVGAVAMVIPGAFASRFRWLIRLGLAGYAAMTIAAWLIQPVFYSTAYIAKAIEVALICLLAIDFFRRDGNPIEHVRHAVRWLLARPHGPASGGR